MPLANIKRRESVPGQGIAKLLKTPRTKDGLQYFIWTRITDEGSVP